VLPTCATCTMPDNVILEMGGPLAAVLHQQVSSSPCDLLAMILGARSRRETVRATDEIEDDAIRTVKMQIRGWIVVDIKDVFDLKAGTFNEEWMKKSVRDREGNENFLGFLRIRKNWQWDIQPSSQDQFIMKALCGNSASGKWPKVYHLVYEVVSAAPGSGLGVPLSRLISKTFSVNKGTISTIPLAIPNLGGCEKLYKVGRSKGTMMKEIELHSGILEGLAIFEKVKGKFLKMQHLLENRSREQEEELARLERQVQILSSELEHLGKQREERLEQGAAMRRLRVLLGPVEAAFQLVMREIKAEREIAELEEEKEVVEISEEDIMREGCSALDKSVRVHRGLK